MDQIARPKRLIIALLLAVLPSVSHVTAAAEVLVKPGNIEVVLPSKPLLIERFAADELTNFLSRVLGAPVPVAENGRAA